jgi:soluble lytic murein transglycosylase-like protein
MTTPTGVPQLPLRTAGPSRPGTRPANQPAATRTNQNAFAQALARAQAQNPALRSLSALPSAAGAGLPGLPPVDQTGLPPELQAMLQQAATPAATPTIRVPGGFGPMIAEAARKYGVEPALIAAVMETESKFNPDAVSQAGAKGLMQLMPATARGLGVTDATDPRQAILGGAKLLGILSQKYDGNLELAVAAYNAGSGAVDQHGGIPPYGETRRYVPLVLAAYERFKTQFGGGR